MERDAQAILRVLEVVGVGKILVARPFDDRVEARGRQGGIARDQLGVGGLHLVLEPHRGHHGLVDEPALFHLLEIDARLRTRPRRLGRAGPDQGADKAKGQGAALQRVDPLGPPGLPGLVHGVDRAAHFAPSSRLRTRACTRRSKLPAFLASSGCGPSPFSSTISSTRACLPSATSKANESSVL